MKRIAALLLLCFAPLLAVAQGEDYAARFARLSHAYALHPTQVDVLFDLAQFYFDNSHPLRNLPLAMDYAQRAEEEHIKLLENNKKIKELTRLTRKDIDLVTLRQAKQAIFAAARNAVAYRKDMSCEEIDAYLAAFGSDADLARQLRQLRLRRVYEDDLATATPEAYYHFFLAYPGTLEAAQMEERLALAAPSLFFGLTTDRAVDSVAALFPQSPAVQQEARRYKSRLAYAQATEMGSKEAFERYLDRYPTSSESQQARERLDALTESDLARRTTALELAHFADSNADLPIAEEALARLRSLIYAHHDVRAAQYYIRHFPLDPFRNEVYGRYYSWHTLEGNGAPLTAFEEANPDFVFPLALENDLDRAEAIDTVPLNEPFKEEDYQRYAHYVRQFMGKGISIVPLQRMLQPLLAAHNYTAAQERIKDFDICFENQWGGLYDSLYRILGTAHAGRTPVVELTDSLPLCHPVVNPADGRLYYTCRTSEGNRIVYAERSGNSWQPAGIVRFSDGTAASDLTLYNFFANGTRMLLGSAGDIWIAEREAGDFWRVSDIPPYPVNTDFIETDAYMLPDGSGLLLASDRPGGRNLQPSGSNFHGDTALATDLWFIPYNRRSWGEPVNLGINTPYCERSPILSRNLRTLYFISDGYGGLGYGDVYVAERPSTDDWHNWRAPRNAGREVNSGLHELSITFGPDERRLYLSSSSLPNAVQSFPSWHSKNVSYSAFDVNVSGLEPYLFRVRVVDLDQQAVVYTADYMGEGSSVTVNVRRDGRYLLIAEAGGRFVPAVPVDKELSGVTLLQGYTFQQLVASDRAMPLHALLFDSATDALQPVARMQLEQLALFLERHPQAVVEFSIDVAGSDARTAYSRSLARGETIRAFLADHGISPSRVMLSPYGNVHLRKSNVNSSHVSLRFREK